MSTSVFKYLQPQKMFVAIALTVVLASIVDESSSHVLYHHDHPAPVLAAPVAVAPPPAQPYSFGYDTQDEYGTRQTRNEVSDSAGNKAGSYGFTDATGIFREVNYIADGAGFRASVRTNEPGTSAHATGGALYNAEPVAVAPAPAPVPVPVPAASRALVAAPLYHYV